jgi:membrane associated rhomboid family serine protease
VGSQCVDCVRASQPVATERVRRWYAGISIPVTKAIILVNTAVFVIGVAQGGASLLSGVGPVQDALGLDAFDVRNGDWYRIVTSGFTHFGLLHLALNMWFIWIVGQLLERAIGSLRFGLIYMAALLAGSAGALILDPNALTAGASGAAFGLLGAAVIGLRQRGVGILRSDLGMLLVLNLGLTFVIPGIAIGGHVGGLIGGGICGYVMLAPRRGPRPAWELLVPIAIGLVSIWLCYWAVWR